MRTCEKCGRPIADSAAACPYCGYSQTEEVPNALQPGWEIAGRYRIESVIGIGGFGITYRAYDKKLACTIALKEYFPSGITNRIPGSKEVILYAGKRTEEFRQGYARFLNEAQNMMQFHSVPNIVQVREYFEENGTAYIVMEYLRGHTLKTEIERAPLEWERTVAIGAVVCDALAALHRKGIVHRDVSPDNIFLCDDGKIKLIDFGAARVSVQQTPLTVVFKDCFTPPEQYSRSAHQGPQTDIYALGATLYTAMLGKKPESALNRWPTDHLKAPHALKPEIPEPVSNAVMQALALEPDILCFDEPTSALDPELTGEVLKVIRGLAEQKTTMIIVTHEMAFARDVADQVIFMDGGFIVEQGDPRQVIDHPQEERTRQFLSRFAENN